MSIKHAADTTEITRQHLEFISQPNMGANTMNNEKSLGEMAWAIASHIRETEVEPLRDKLTELSDGAISVLVERKRQKLIEGWTEDHDDRHTKGEMARAASAYAHAAGNASERNLSIVECFVLNPRDWPWEENWWKPCERRKMLAKAGALILAELERLDRLAAYQATKETK